MPAAVTFSFASKNNLIFVQLLHYQVFILLYCRCTALDIAGAAVTVTIAVGTVARWVLNQGFCVPVGNMGGGGANLGVCD